MPKESEVSVIVISAGGQRMKRLKGCLESLSKQAYENFELILVNDGGSVRDMEALASSLALKFKKGKGKLKLINHKKRMGIAAARNTGIRAAKGEICVFLDDDIIAGNDYLMNLIKPYKNKKIGGVGSLILSPKGDAITEGIAVRYYFHMDENYMRTAGDVHALRGTSMSFRAKALRDAGGFDEHLGKSVFMDDAEISFAVRNLGYKLAYEPSAVVTHYWGTAGGCKPNMLFRGYHWIRARLYVMLKHHSFFAHPLSIPMLIAYGARKYVRTARAHSAGPFVIAAGLLALPFGIPAAVKLWLSWKIRRHGFI